MDEKFVKEVVAKVVPVSVDPKVDPAIRQAAKSVLKCMDEVQRVLASVRLSKAARERNKKK